jgi:hypothetical protein
MPPVACVGCSFERTAPGLQPAQQGCTLRSRPPGKGGAAGGQQRRHLLVQLQGHKQ